MQLLPVQSKESQWYTAQLCGCLFGQYDATMFVLQIYEDARCEYLKCKETHQKLVKLCKEEEKKAQPLTAEKEKFLQRMTAMDKLMKSKVGGSVPRVVAFRIRNCCYDWSTDAFAHRRHSSLLSGEVFAKEASSWSTSAHI